MSFENNDIPITGDTIKAIRQKYGLSQQAFGARLGVSHAHISKIESGKENPSETLQRLIKYEFKIDTLAGIPSPDITRPQIKQYLHVLDNLTANYNLSDGSLYNIEFLLASLISLLQKTSTSPIFFEQLTDNIAGIIDQTASFIETTGETSLNEEEMMVRTTKLLWSKKEIEDCAENICKLLVERVN